MASSKQMPLDERLREYLDAVRRQGSHTGKVIQFVRFLEKTYGLASTDYEVEEQVGHLQVRGRIDTVIGDSLFEFKTDLGRELADAEIQLKKYLGGFHDKNPLRRCVGIATDGVKFRVYQPDFSLGPTPELPSIEEQDLSKLSGEDAVLWLDRYLFRHTPKFPDDKDVSARFGGQSPTYAVTKAALRQWWQQVKDDPPVALKYEVWQKQLTIVYGEGIGSEDLFLQHTYLATVAKLLASVVFPQPAPGGDRDILTGAYFQGLGIHNFVEEDLFAWLLHPDIESAALRLLRDLRTQLGQYDPTGFTEDVLKGLYQQLVDPQTRQLLGEFYTPDWLADYMLSETVAEMPECRILDPACGSGTFLFLAIRLVTEALRKRRWPKQRILEHIEQSIVGVDVHPLAVLIARTNCLIAAGPLLARRAKPFTVPVYLGDSLMYRSVVGAMFVPDVNVPADGDTLWFPGSLRENPALFDDVVSNLVYWAERGEDGADGFSRFVDGKGLKPSERKMLLDSFRVMAGLFAAGRDSIWRFVILNLIRPYILSRGQLFDVVIGNPPWLSLRYIKSPDYQKFVKDQMNALHIKPKGAKLVTQLDLAALFFAEAAGRYLKDRGLIAFVMPRSVLVHKQYEEFLKFRFGPVGARCDRILDLEAVRPLFSVPACAIFATKGEATRYPVPRIIMRGRLSLKNASWDEAQRVLEVEKAQWAPAQPGTRSFYYDSFRQGATIVPRRFWFVRAVLDPRLGFDPSAPLVETDTTLPAKRPWADVSLYGQVESKFLYGSVISTDLLPFVLQKVRPVVLPVELDAAGRPRLLSAADALREGHRKLSAWLEVAEAEWARHRKHSSPNTAVERVDYHLGLSAQFPQARRYVVVYAAAARETVAAVVDMSAGLRVVLDEGELTLVGLAAEHQVYWFATDRREEAHYLSGWLNAQAVDDAVRPRELWGRYRERHLEKRPLELPLPRFWEKDSDHVEMAALAQKAATLVPGIAGGISSRSLGSVRRQIRTDPGMAPILARIDELARKIGGL